MKLSDEPREQLKTLYERYGNDLLHPRDRAWGLLADMCAGHRAENFLLGSVAREGLVTAVIGKGYTGAAAVAALTHRVKSALGLDDERAGWVASAWGEACGWLPSSNKAGTFEQGGLSNTEHSTLGMLVEAVVRGFGETIGDTRLRDKLPDAAVSSLATHCTGNSADEVIAAVLWPSVLGDRGLLFCETGLRFRNPDNATLPGSHHLTYQDLRRLPRPRRTTNAVVWDTSALVLSTAGTGIPSSSVVTLLSVVREVVAFCIT